VERRVGNRREFGAVLVTGEAMTRYLEHHDATAREHAGELLHVASTELRCDVLQHDVGIDEVEDSVVEQREIVTFVDVVVAAVAETIELAGALDHRRRDVDPVALREAAREGLGQTPDATTEIERASGRVRDAEIAQPRVQIVDLVDSGREEFLDVPVVGTAVGTREDREVRISAPPLVPVALQLVEIHTRC
jgi:hypothetical protein